MYLRHTLMNDRKQTDWNGWSMNTIYVLVNILMIKTSVYFGRCENGYFKQYPSLYKTSAFKENTGYI